MCSQEDSTPPAERLTRATNYLATVVRVIQDYSLALWSCRNAALHDQNTSSLAIVQATLNQEITQLYELQDSFSPILQSYFHLPLESRLTKSSRHKQRWLQLTRLATSHASAKGSRQQVISTYFPYAPASDAPPRGSASITNAPPATAFFNNCLFSSVLELISGRIFSHFFCHYSICPPLRPAT